MDQPNTPKPASAQDPSGQGTPAVPPPVPAGTDPLQAELAVLLERVEAKVVDIQNLQAARRRRTIILAVLLFGGALWFIGQVVTPFRELFKNSAAFFKAVEKEQATTFLPILRYEFQKVVPLVYAAYEKSFQDAWEKRLPKVQGMVQEFELLLSQIGKHLGQQAVFRTDFLLDRYQKKLENDFPEIAHDEEALEAIHDALQSTITTVLGSRFHRPFEKVATMRDAFLAVPVPDRFRKMNDAQLQETLIDLINAHLNLQFKPLMDNLHFLREGLMIFEDQILDLFQQFDGSRSGTRQPVTKGEK
jgi:hypothetical protein